MRRRRMRAIAKLVLFAWLFSSSLAAAQLCLESPASHVQLADGATHRVDTPGDHGNPADSDDDCPVLPDAAVDTWSAEPAHDFSDAVAVAPVFYLHLAVGCGSLRNAWKRTVDPVHLSALVVAHRLRL